MDFRIINIGALSRHELRPDNGAPRTACATTTLVRSGGMTLIVDPGLPERAMAEALSRRAGITPGEVTHVFLTNFRPAHRLGLSAFPQAKCWIGEHEREAVGTYLVERFQEAEDDQTRDLFRQEIALMQRLETAPDKLEQQVDLFPCPGYTPGTCGLLLSESNLTIVIAGDSVATAEHLEQGRILRGAFDANLAKASLAEVIEIADLIVPGHDNLLINRTRRPF